MKLTSTQVRYLPGVLWLTDPNNRGEGKTTLLAYAFLMNAVQCIGQPIEVWDHVPHYSSKMKLVNKLRDLFKEMHLDKRYTLTITHSDGTICLNRIKGVPE